MATCPFLPESSSHLPRHLSLYLSLRQQSAQRLSLSLSVQSSFTLLYICSIHQRWPAYRFLRHHLSLLPLHLHFQGAPSWRRASLFGGCEFLASLLRFVFLCHSSIKQHYIAIYSFLACPFQGLSYASTLLV